MICDNITVSESGRLLFAGQDTVELARQYGTPLYLMDEDKIRENCRVYAAAFQKHFGDRARPLYASKANSFKRIYEIMKEQGLTDVSRVGLYGLTYKENVDDMRESPTLQLLESQERHLATGLKVYDPFITKDVVKNQYHDLDAFLADVDMVVVMVKHTEIRENVDKLAGKVVLDCHNIIDLPGVYHI